MSHCLPFSRCHRQEKSPCETLSHLHTKLSLSTSPLGGPTDIPCVLRHGPQSFSVEVTFGLNSGINRRYEEYPARVARVVAMCRVANARMTRF